MHNRLALALSTLLVCSASCGRSDSNVFSPPPSGTGEGQIGNFVWSDLDRDGIQDPGEPGLPGVEVVVRDSDGNEVARLKSDESGRIVFTLPAPAAYVLEVDETSLPKDSTPTKQDVGSDDSIDSDGSPLAVELADGQKLLDVAFGYHPIGNADVGDFVWHDADMDGIQDPGEPGIDGVTVILRDANGQEVARTKTGQSRAGTNGFYQFDSLKKGEYAVDIDPSTLPPRFVSSPSGIGSDRAVDSNALPAKLVLDSNDAKDPTIDFGFHPPKGCTASIGDRVWLDMNGNGCQEAGEKGLANVRVVLTQNGKEIREARTNVTGLYSFEGLCAGTYEVSIDAKTVPPCLKPSPCEACNDITVDSNCIPAKVVLAENDSKDPTIDFGFQPEDNGTGGKQSIGGRIWNDIDNDGIEEPGEPSIEKVRVLLRDKSGKILYTVFSTKDGYKFDGLCQGSYIVEVDDKTLPPGLVLSPCKVGNDPKIDNDCSPAKVDLPFNGSEEDIDVGYFAPPRKASIGDFVWCDLDRDGIQDKGEPGFKGIRIILKDAHRKVLRTQTTDQFGNYRFECLHPGTYFVEVDPRTCPPGFVMSPSNVGNDRSIDSNPSPSRVELAKGQVEDTIDFGFYSLCSLSLGDFVWHDLDADGIQDPGEPGIESVRLILKDRRGTVIAKEFTDHRGHYRFQNVCPGGYIVEVDRSTLPKGLVQTRCHSGSDPSKDSNCSPANAYLRTDPDHRLDFGYKRPSPPKDNQGCSSAFWKNNPKLWPVNPQMMFSGVFADAFAKKTLFDVISKGGGGLDGLGRDAVAAYLNAKSTKVRYFLTDDVIKAFFNRVYTRTEAERYALKKYFEQLNSTGCPLH